MNDKINLTEEQDRMWKKLSTPYAPIIDDVGNYGAYGGYAYAPPGVGYKTKANGTSSIAFGYLPTKTKLSGAIGIVIGA